MKPIFFKPLPFAVALAIAVSVGCQNSTDSQRVLFPESRLSVLEIELQSIKCDGLDSSTVEAKDSSRVGIKFEGFARLGVDLSKAEFNLQGNNLSIKLPSPEITEVVIVKSDVWDWFTNTSDRKELDKLAVDLCNKALTDFRDLAKDDFYIDCARHVAKRALIRFYKVNHPSLILSFE